VSIEVNEPPLVTWLLPVRNSMPYLRETLASMAAQTYPHHRVLAWDAESTDGSRELLHEWIPGKIAGEVVSEAQNRARNPLGESLRRMVLHAKTELCARIDSDDLSLPERLERQVETMSKRPSLVMIGSEARYIDRNSKLTGVTWRVPLNDSDLRWRVKWMVSFGHTSVMFRRSSVLAAGNYRNDIKLEDHDLWIRMSYQGEMGNLAEHLTRSRRHSSSLTSDVQDYRPLYREAAARNAALLFPGIAEEEAMRLWEASYFYDPMRPVRFRDLRNIRSVAVKFARTLGVPADYFTRTELFRAQFWHMRRNFLHGLGLRPALELYGRLRGQKNTPET